MILGESLGLTGIQPLSTELVHRIAAGEVIDSPAAVVRELIDNAIDAQATRIVIALWPDNWRIKVSDNGVGLSWADLKQAAAPHTTSKLRSGDLSQIRTLGFRGEALHSLTQVGQLNICSRRGDEGWQVTYDRQGQVAEVNQVAIASGTIATVDQLFWDWPARKQALPSLTQQLRSIQAVIHSHALCHPQITWQVYQGERQWFSIAPGQTAQDILPQILSTLDPGDLRCLKVPFNNGTEYLEVLLGLPDRCHRHRPDWVRVAVNGRCVQVSGDDNFTALRPLEQTILRNFRQTLPRHRYPLCFIHLYIEPEQVDWNRHPAKTDIYLRDLEQWQQRVAAVIQELLKIPDDADAGHSQKIQQLVKVAEGKGVYNLQQSSLLSNTEEDHERLHELRAIAQLHQTYILAEHTSGMWLIEQHIAHERVLYEQLQKDWQLVPLTPPIMLPDLTEQQVNQLTHFGLEIEIFGPHLWAIRSAPEPLAKRSDCQEALLELSQCTELDAALVATACRSAIRNGTPLALPEMQTLLDQWQRTQRPRTCPHGRPIYLSLEETNLARFFRRHWVIGKSHGI
ncbi:DNA mismatch repair protein MutL [Acaryochloris thomasi RCC1774]|uniref:DNA mismatch repair protein MutL n=1 Tax=Acaryochloris thomasi RCC1774 TaxID=1764569 RepID=A0A2W1JNX5_9CYAN|nr:DNA mismatch repair protein MutL [Acaryochloris thomasi RCC1774]